MLAWRLALRHEGVEIPNAFLHRCIGMRGELLIKAAFKEIGRTFRDRTRERLEKLHKRYFEQALSSINPLPGSGALLKSLVTAEDFLGHSDRWRQAHRAEDDPAPSYLRQPLQSLQRTMSNMQSLIRTYF